VKLYSSGGLPLCWISKYIQLWRTLIEILDLDGGKADNVSLSCCYVPFKERFIPQIQVTSYTVPFSAFGPIRWSGILASVSIITSQQASSLAVLTSSVSVKYSVKYQLLYSLVTGGVTTADLNGLVKYL
jgi:hypothetical protein